MAEALGRYLKGVHTYVHVPGLCKKHSVPGGRSPRVLMTKITSR